MLKNKKILCLIPAKGNSKGIKYKNLKKIKNKSLLEAAIDFAKNLTFIDHTVVSSENEKIINIAKNKNCGLHKRNKYLTRDHTSDYELIKAILKKKKYQNFDYLLYLQPTSPIRYKKDFISGFKKIIDSKSDSIWSVTKVSNKYHPLKILKPKNKFFFENYLKEGKKIVARQQLSNIYIRNGIFYIFSVKSLIKQKSIYLRKNLFYEIKYKHENIDTLNDLKLCRTIASKLKLNL